MVAFNSLYLTVFLFGSALAYPLAGSPYPGSLHRREVKGGSLAQANPEVVGLDLPLGLMFDCPEAIEFPAKQPVCPENNKHLQKAEVHSQQLPNSQYLADLFYQKGFPHIAATCNLNAARHVKKIKFHVKKSGVLDSEPGS